MPDKAASTLGRLKNKAKETGRSYQLCLQLFCQEEFLRKLEKSKYANNFVLKGGLFIYALTSFESRATIDIDFLIKSLPNTPEQMEIILKEILLSDTGNDFVRFKIHKIEKINIAKKYSGIGVSLIAEIKNTKTPVGIDLSIGDVVIPKQEKRNMPTQLDDFKSPTVNTYSLESTIAEKLDAILSMMEFSSRMKDYYDIYYLSCKFDFDGALLQKAIKKTFVTRERLYSIDLFNQVMSFGSDDVMVKKWQAFLNKLKVEKVVFDNVLETMNAFLGELYKTIINNTEFNKQWSSAIYSWK